MNKITDKNPFFYVIILMIGVNMKTKERESNIELLRILSMFMIILFHLGCHGVTSLYSSSITINNMYINYMDTLGRIGVNVFVLISGYLLVNRKRYNYKKLILLWLQILFYSVCLYYVSVIIFKNSNANLLRALLPLSTRRWWFATTYFVLYLIYPYINIFVKNISKKEFEKLLIILTLVFCMWPTIINTSMESNSITLFIYLYLIGAYIKLYVKINYTEEWLLYTIVLFIVSVLMIIVFYYIKLDYRIVFGDFKFLTLLISVVLFLTFLNIKIKNSNIINTIGKSTFGIYLLHECPDTRKYMWIDIFKTNTLYRTPYLIPKTLLFTLIVFCVCFIIEYIRMTIESKILLLIEKRKGANNEKEKTSI